MNQPLNHKSWGGATGWLDRSRKLGWFDLIFVLAVAALVVGLWQLGVHLNERPPHSSDEAVQSIHLEPWYLPIYTFYSLMRGVIAYVFSLLFTLVYGYWAAKDRVAQRVLIPLLDILQSIPSWVSRRFCSWFSSRRFRPTTSAWNWPSLFPSSPARPGT